ncbi:hypothetical protein [Shewanella salipaludis]|uniref:Uncharacterized protein n=1 Tax=Shewanella salipaludis TaxID=2723052 RepID=A0A972FVF4_9GAMM|nr:hypothetical protein [Shewanella salipaludis]NMH66004.1 hypothetical protein [Shewanella salipaludis]
MKNAAIEVSFGVHVPDDSVQSMITGMAAYGIVHDTDKLGKKDGTSKSFCAFVPV